MKGQTRVAVGMFVLLMMSSGASADQSLEAENAYYAGLERLDEGEFEASISAFTLAIELAPDYAAAYAARAKAQRALGNVRLALKDEEAAADLRLANDFKRDIAPQFWWPVIRYLFIPAILIFAWLIMRRINILRNAKAPDFE